MKKSELAFLAGALVSGPEFAHAEDAKTGDALVPPDRPAASAAAPQAPVAPQAPGGAKGAEPGSKSAGALGGYSYSDKKVTGTAPAKKAHSSKHPPGKGHIHASNPTFSMTENGASRVTVTLSSTVNVTMRKVPHGVVYTLPSTTVVRPNDKHALVSVHFNTPMTAAKLVSTAKGTELHIDLRADVEPQFKVESQTQGASLVVDLPAGNFVKEVNEPVKEAEPEKDKSAS